MGNEGSNKMSPAGMAFLGVGTMLSAYGKYNSWMERADAEAQNARFYREQADYAGKSGARQHTIYEHESKVMYGEQLSGFAKAGIDSANSSFFMASQMLQRSQGLDAIDKETAMNERLAQLRADEASRVSGEDENAATLEVVGTVAMTAAMFMSDQRAKKDVVRLSASIFKSVPTYLFRYIDEKFGRGWFIGTMAQDLLQVDPSHPAVSYGPDGYFRVNYLKVV